ncbi:uncharacterized protein ACB058_015438 isoform 1-T2 [Synchiropus picturatus]
MFAAWWLLCLLLPGVRPFMLHHSRTALCLEEEEATGTVQMKRCALDSQAQQWAWLRGGRLRNVASLRCVSAQPDAPVRTVSCDGSGGDPSGLEWDCDSNRLMARKAAMFLTVAGRQVALAPTPAHVKWRSVDVGDICQEKLRSKRASGPNEEVHEEERVMLTEEEKQYLRWFYRTEDPTIWKFVLLGFAFVCLLIGFLLLGMGIMGSKNRRKIARIKAALAQRSNMEELQVMSTAKDDGEPSTPGPQHAAKTPPVNGDVMDVKAGSIVVTWKDGNTSNLYSDPGEEEEERGSVEEEEDGEEGGERLADTSQMLVSAAATV